jgi:hypothetical protein
LEGGLEHARQQLPEVTFSFFLVARCRQCYFFLLLFACPAHGQRQDNRRPSGEMEELGPGAE